MDCPRDKRSLPDSGSFACLVHIEHQDNIDLIISTSQVDLKTGILAPQYGKEAVVIETLTTCYDVSEYTCNPGGFLF